MKKFEMLGVKLSLTEMKNISGGNVCYATCENGVTWGLNCSSGSCGASTDTIGAIQCGGQLYFYGCPAFVKM